jgi:stage V sporulation protein D (sporulation-specific penicillin-binding protein)
MTERMNKRANVRIRKRTLSLLLIYCGLILVILGKLFYIQVLNNDYYFELAQSQRMRHIPLYAERGTIYDRNLTELAVSIKTDGVYATPRSVIEPDKAAKELSKLLEISYGEIYEKLTKDSYFVWLSMKVPLDKALQVKGLKMQGIATSETFQRFYPKKELSAHILGVAGMDNQGLEGLEIFYEDILAGVSGSIKEEQAPGKRAIPQGKREVQKPLNGYDLVLTIDEGLQYIAERELKKGVMDSKASKGTIIVMSVDTGEILAMANYPAFDPNEFTKYPSSVRRNIAITDIYEPGSTFKVITAAIALEEGLVRPNELLFDPGYIVVDRKKINCESTNGHGWVTFAEAIAASCNPILAQVGLRIPKVTLYEYLRDFNFGSKTGIDFPGEAPGLLIPERNLKPVEMATISFGQGISVTPLQMVSAVSVIANGGILMKPHLVKQVLDKKGQVHMEFEPEPVRQVISHETALMVKEMMEMVVSTGTGSRAAISGYRVAGKTGTSQKPEGGVYGNKRIASFVGFAPVEAPKLSAIVVLDDPKVSSKYGGVLAAPVFKAVMEDSLRYIGIPPRLEEKGSSSDKEPVPVPNVIGKSPVEAKRLISSAKLRDKAQGEGNLVVDQHPRAGTFLPTNSHVVIYLKAHDASEMVTVPNVLGLTMKRAAQVLSEFGLKLNPVGSGIAVKINPSVGTKVNYGSIIEVIFN